MVARRILGAVTCAVTVAAMLALGSAGAAPAQEAMHAISQHGTPKYGPGFTHFDYANPDAPKGGEIRLSAFGSFDSLNPFILRGQVAVGAGLVFETLTTGSGDEVTTEYGELAETITLAPDRSWVEYALRPQARFHDGRPVTAEDVIWSFETLKEKGHPHYRTYYADVVKAEKTGDRKVRFTFRDTGNSELPVIMGQLPVLPRHVFETRDFAATTLDPIVGSGPYRIESVQPGRGITYRRVEDWWAKDLPLNKGRYNFDRIRYDYYRDLDVAFEAFKAGGYDFRSEHSSKNWATGYDIPAVRDGQIVKEEIRHEDPRGMQAFVFNIRRPLFQDRRVREALNQLFDYEWTRANLSYGLYRRTKSYFANSELAATGTPGEAELKILEPYRGKVPEEVFTKAFEPPVTDGTGNIRPQLRTALGLFKQAGWELKDGKLVNVKTGEPMRFEILMVQADLERIVQPFVRNLERAGIQAAIRVVDSAQYQNRTDNFDYDMIIASFAQSLSPGNEQRDYWNSARADQPGSRNLIGIKDPVVDELIEKLIQAPDRDSLIAHTRALDRVLLWNWYVIPHWHDNVYRVAYWNRFSHPAVAPKHGLAVIDTWWVDPAKAARTPSTAPQTAN
ncbi:ABC transporter substrate-binding protein [Azospirillum sp. RWY-5-1]|uniref:ABC transporter substrate-binding protein n=1 Tax=Azospirillum oleiclasticum TaxID=2735135 RepID=A0ABX2TAV8_9PROT|nr:extracellular solute-binding protein [Azospirillum oleiclasticum]NYZ15270.1 ABC transporter substrate-binding protein [Azospirillum oleiclasticum]NYZ21309.1 ABC transporter substrate-binding protein [Azospirillum oleiclasticum]